MALETWKRLSPQRAMRLDKAIKEWTARRDRGKHPSGEFDNAGRWTPCADTEKQDCCESIRYPSRRFPYSLNKHCRTMLHIASLFDCDLIFLRRRIRKIRDLMQRQIDNPMNSPFEGPQV